MTTFRSEAIDMSKAFNLVIATPVGAVVHTRSTDLQLVTHFQDMHAFNAAVAAACPISYVHEPVNDDLEMSAVVPDAVCGTACQQHQDPDPIGPAANYERCG